MKYAVLLFAALAIIWIKCSEAGFLQEDTMDTYKTNINLLTPFYGTSSSGILKSHKGFRYTVGRNKTLYVSAPSGYRLLVSIRLIDLRPLSQDMLKLFAVNGFTAPTIYVNNFSSKQRRYYPQEDLLYYVPNGQLGITFTTGPFDNNYGYDGFELVYTVQATGYQCNSGDFRCNNGWCIAKILKCDDHNHCGDGSSERDCSIHGTGRTVGITFGAIFIIIAIACGVYIVIRKSRGTVTETVVTSHPPPINQPYPPPYQQPGTYYPPPPPPYSQGGVNTAYH